MTGSRLAGLAAVIVLACLSALCAVLAADVIRAERAVAQADSRFGAVTGRDGMWEADTTLPDGVVRRLLGVDDDLAYRRAVQRFRLSRPREPVVRFAQLGSRAAADRALARAARSDADPERRSALHNLRGALALEEARLGSDSTPALRRAATQFRLAVELDARNDDARWNLELALRLLSRSGSTSGGSGERAATPASGAGSATAGSGY